MRSRRGIAENWLPRYTGAELGAFGGYVLLTNFDRYVRHFADWHGVPMCGAERPMPSATAGEITIINFGLGSATAGTVMDLLSAIYPKAVRFRGKCGGLKPPAGPGDLVLPFYAGAPVIGALLLMTTWRATRDGVTVRRRLAVRLGGPHGGAR